MRVRRFQMAKDYGMLESWMAARGKSMRPRSWLPKRGFLVDNVACIFLVKTDSKVGVLEFFITNPKAKPEDRLEACELLIVSAKNEAITMGLEAIFGHAQIPKVIGYGLKFGFTYDPKPYYEFHMILNEEKSDVRRISGPERARTGPEQPQIKRVTRQAIS